MAEDSKVAELLRQMTPEQKLITAMKMYWAARALKAAALRSFHPDWTEARIQEEVRWAFLTMRD